MTRPTRFIVAGTLAGAVALGIGGIAAAQDSDDGDLTVTELQSPEDSAVLAQTDPTTPTDDSTTDDSTGDSTTDDSTATDPATDDAERGGRGGPGGCDEGEGGATGTDPGAGSSAPTPEPSTAETVPATDPASEA